MTPKELACIKSIDSAIMQLQAIRLALVSAVVENTTEVANNDTPEGACSHNSVQNFEMMGERKVSLCLDCDLQWEPQQ